MINHDSDRPAIRGGTPIRPSGPPEWPRIDVSVERVLKSMIKTGDWGRYHGPHVPALCQRLAEFHGVSHVLTCSSGTSAIELALRGVGVGPGDEVILAAYDFKANFQNILHLQATPVLVDLDPQTWQLDPSRIEAGLSSKTRAIVMSHLHGGVVDARRVRDIADRHSIALVEDACQNPGAMIFDRRAGTWGDVGVLSFGGSKLLTAGRGGAILTSKPEIAERIKRQTLRGNDAYPLSEIQAAMILPQLEQLDDLNVLRCDRVERICSDITAISGLTPLQLPTSDIRPAYYKVGFQYTADAFEGLSRSVFVAAIQAEGIAMDAGFRANHLIHATRRFRKTDELPHATKADSAMVTLYHPVLLEDEPAVDQIVAAIRKIRDHASELSKECPSEASVW